MIISEKYVKINYETIKSELDLLDKNNYKLLIEEYFLFNGLLQLSDFGLDDYNEEDNLSFVFKKKLKNFYELSLDYDYQKTNIYKLKIIQISFKNELLYYIKYELMEKNEQLFLKIKNKNLNFVIKNYKIKLNKFSNFFLQKKNLLNNQIIFENNNNNLLNHIDQIKSLVKLKKEISSLSNIRNLLKNKKLKEEKVLYSQFLISLKLNKKLNEKIEDNKEFKLKLYTFKKNIKNKLNKLISKKKELSEANLLITQKLSNEYCNYQIKTRNFW